MNQTPNQPKFEAHSFQIVLDSKGEEPVQIEAGSWRGVRHVGIRQLFRGNDERLYYGKQGYNCPIGDLPHLITALLECYNKATGSLLTLHSADELVEAQLAELASDVVHDEVLGTPEPVHTWQRGA